MVTLRLVTDNERPGPPPGPRAGECLACFVERMVRAHGCYNRLTWAQAWRDRQAPRATGLERRLESGGGFCDCEILLNVYVRSTPKRIVPTGEARAEPKGQPSGCLSVRKGSTRACPRWVEVS